MANFLYALYLTSCLLANFEYGGLGDLLSRTEANRSLHFFYGNERQLHTVRNERDEFYRFTRDGNRAVIKEQGEVGLVPFLYQGPVPRHRDGTGLQPLPLLLSRNRSIHQPRPHSP